MHSRKLQRAALTVALFLGLATGCAGNPSEPGTPPGTTPGTPGMDAGMDSELNPDGSLPERPDGGEVIPPNTGCLSGELPSFRALNESAHSREQWANVTLPFAPGELCDDAVVTGLRVGDQPAELVPLKHHYDSNTGERAGVALAQLRVRVSLAAGEERVFTPELEETAMVDPWAIDPEIRGWLGMGAEFAQVMLDIDGQTYTAPLLGGIPTTFGSGGASRTLRFRTHFRRDGELHPLSLTTYLVVDSRSRSGELVFLVGNDTLRFPVGGLDFTNLRVEVPEALHLGLRDPQIYGVTDDDSDGVLELLAAGTLGDGQSVPFRGAWAFGEADSTYRARLESRLIPIASWESWRRSNAAGAVGIRVDRRGDRDAALSAIMAEGAANPASASGAFDHRGYINQSPPNTGAQPDFVSAVPMFFLKSVQAESQLPVNHALHAVDREALRPSFYWALEEGGERRVRANDAPNLVWHGGRMHWHPGRNIGADRWLPRADGFDGGNPGLWKGMDAQHYGNNSLRAVYELTGDWYLRDLLRAHQTLVYWDELTTDLEFEPSERTMRAHKEGVLLYALDDEWPVAPLIRERTILRNAEILRHVRESLTEYGTPALGTHTGDTRTQLGVDYPTRPIALSWQTGFHMEFQSLCLRNGWGVDTARAVTDLYLDAADAYFRPSGQPVTNFVADEPSIWDDGSITYAWWAGWVQMAEHRQDHEAARTFISGPVRAFVLGVIDTPPGAPWSEDLGWKSFD